MLYKKWYKKIKAKKWSRIKWRIPLTERSEEANNRSENGHFEADLVVSKKWCAVNDSEEVLLGCKYAILTLIDRKSRLPRIHLLKDKSSTRIMEIIKSEKEKLGIKSVTFDNWMEFGYHHLLQESWINTFFCEPYHSREKWSIENLNRIIRRWYPKWTDFADYTQEEIERVCNIIADSPREILGFKTANQVHFS